MPGKIALSNNFPNSMSSERIIPPLGPLKVLCVVEVTTCAYFIGLGYSPAAINPE